MAQTPVIQDLAYQRPPFVTLADYYAGGGVSTLVAAGPGTSLIRQAAQAAGEAPINSAVGPSYALPSAGRTIVIGLLGLIVLGYIYHHPKGIL